jgi:hypothetical protein
VKTNGTKNSLKAGATEASINKTTQTREEYQRQFHKKPVVPYENVIKGR